MTLDKKITEWILEYCYDLAKREFKEKKQIEDSISRDFIQGVLDQLEVCGEESLRDKCMVQVLVIMCKLADGQDITVEYEEGTELSALEGVIERLDCLAEALDHQLDFTDFRNLVKQQAVFVFARNSDFVTAEAIALRVFGTRASPEEKTFKRRSDDVLKAKDAAHPFLSQFSYDKLLDACYASMDQLEAHFHIHKPFLLQFAEKFADVENDKSATQKRCWKELDVGVQGDTLRRLLQHFGAKSVPLSPRRRAEWSKRRAAVRKNKDEVLGNIEMILSSGDMNGTMDDTTDEEDSETRLSASMSDTSPVLRRQKRRSHSSKSAVSSTREKKQKESLEESSSEEIIMDERTPVSRLPARPSPTKPPRKSLGLAITPKPQASRRTNLNVSRLSHLSIGGRSKRPWEAYEEETLWEGILTFGPGKWAKIKEMQGLPLRSAVDIKDKWRNLTKDKHKFRQLTDKLGRIPDKKMKK